MPHYMLLLYDDPSHWRSASPGDLQKAMEKYVAWRKKSYVVDSNRLTEDPGKVLRSSQGRLRAIDGPYSETKEVLGGYYTIEASSYDEAVERTRDHPHLEYGGTVEVRQVWA
ncbi:MAG: YciI family protein [Bryobacteraceae bacterium]